MYEHLSYAVSTCLEYIPWHLSKIHKPVAIFGALVCFVASKPRGQAFESHGRQTSLLEHHHLTNCKRVLHCFEIFDNVVYALFKSRRLACRFNVGSG